KVIRPLASATGTATAATRQASRTTLTARIRSHRPARSGAAANGRPGCQLPRETGVAREDPAEVLVDVLRLAVRRRVEGRLEGRTELGGRVAAERVGRPRDVRSADLPDAVARAVGAGRVGRIEGRSCRRVDTAGAGARVGGVGQMPLARGI